MIWQLVKRDPAWRNTLKCAVVAAVAGSALPHRLIWMFGLLIGMCWAVSQPQQRATLFEAALPIRVRDLFLARILSLLAAVWLPVVSGAAFLLAAGRAAGDAVILVGIGSAISLLVLAVQSWRVRELAGPSWLVGASVAIVWPAASLISELASRIVVPAVCAPLCGLLFWNIWRQLPAAFEVLPAKLAPQAFRAGNAAPAFAGWPILRSLFHLRPLGFLPMIVFLPLAGIWPYVAMFCVFPVQASLERLAWVLSLPIRRGALLAVILLPWIAPLLLSVWLGAWFPHQTPIQFDRLPDGNASAVRPPLEFWRVAPHGTSPLIQAPWGESWQPETMSFGGIAIYNPYGMGPGNSRRFFEWQYLRATEAVYGQPVAFADYKRLATLRPVNRQTRFVLLNLAACACLVMFLVNLFFTHRHWRLGRIFPRGQVAFWWLITALMMVPYLLEMTLKGMYEPISVSLVNALLLRVSPMLPLSLPALALAAAIPVALLCWTAARLFRGLEIPLAGPAAQG